MYSTVAAKESHPSYCFSWAWSCLQAPVFIVLHMQSSLFSASTPGPKRGDKGPRLTSAHTRFLGSGFLAHPLLIVSSEVALTAGKQGAPSFGPRPALSLVEW
jgi:hypothetical protein